MVALAAIGAPVRAAASADASRRPSSATSRRRLGGAPASIDSRRKARLIGRRETRDVRVEVIDPLSIAVGGALVGLGRGFLERAGASPAETAALEVVPAIPDSHVSNADVVQAAPVGALPELTHSFAGVFDAAGTGALSGVVSQKLSGGWWDGGRGDARPAMELQAINPEARDALVACVLGTLEEAFEAYDPEPGFEAEAAQDLLSAVAETATTEWLLRSRDAAQAAVSAAGGVSGAAYESEEDAVDATMVRRAGELASALVSVGDVESPGSKSALYVNLFSHMSALSRAAEAVAQPEAGEVAEAAVELAAEARRRADEGAGFSMAAVSVSVLEDATLRVAESVASAYLSRVREGAAAPGVARQRAARKFASKRAMLAAREADAKKVAVIAASSAAKVVRYALQLQPVLKSTRSLEKFRNEVKLRAWLEANYKDVVAMYEDWHGLVGLDADGNIVTRRVSINRHSELAQVKGVRLIVSMFLEFADVVVPVAQSALRSVKEFSSWLLVTLIGRSLGLVYRGIRESMNGNANGNDAAGPQAPRFA